MSLPDFSLLFQTPGIAGTVLERFGSASCSRARLADAFYNAPLDADAHPVRRAVRDCLGICGDVTKCFMQRGTRHSHCLELFFNSRGCLAARLTEETRRRHGEMDQCMQREQSFTECARELRLMHGAVEKALKDLTDESKEGCPAAFNEAEQRAWSNCGSPTRAASGEHLNLLLGCSMQQVCPEQLQRWATCQAGGDNTCETESRQLLAAFRPYMDKVYLRDAHFLVRGSSEPELLKM